jgi:hypothetical protein
MHSCKKIWEDKNRILRPEELKSIIVNFLLRLYRVITVATFVHWCTVVGNTEWVLGLLDKFFWGGCQKIKVVPFFVFNSIFTSTYLGLTYLPPPPPVCIYTFVILLKWHFYQSYPTTIFISFLKWHFSSVSIIFFTDSVNHMKFFVKYCKLVEFISIFCLKLFLCFKVITNGAKFHQHYHWRSSVNWHLIKSSKIS